MRQEIPSINHPPTDPKLESSLHRSSQSRATYLELLCHAPDVSDLDPRVRLNLQQALLGFVKDEQKWLALPAIEQRRLLKRLTNRMGQTLYFAETVTLPCPNEQGELVPTQVNLLLDATRNPHLSRIFDQIVNPEIATTFHQEFCFGLLELIDALVALEEKLLSHADTDLMQSYLIYTLVPEGDLGLLPFSLEDLETIRESRVGIQVQLIPRFLRLPLNRLYHAVLPRSQEFPSLTLQFYLDRFFSTALWKHRCDPSPRREEFIRILLTKAFYAVVRSGGLTMEQMELPQPKRLSWSEYLTLDDHSSTRLDLETARLEQQSRFQRIQERLEMITQFEHQMVTQRRPLNGPVTMVELTYIQVLNDALGICLEQEAATKLSPDQSCSRIGLPSLPLSDPPIDDRDLSAYLKEITGQEYLARLPQTERQRILKWEDKVSMVLADTSILRQLEALGQTPDYLRRDLLLLFAERHRWLVNQNIDTILSIIASNVTRMMQLGTVTPEVVVRQRYEFLKERLLPFVYYVADQNTDAWLASPYPYGTLLLAIQRTYQRQEPNSVLAAQLLEELARVEWHQNS